MKKVLTIILIAIFAVVLFAACNRNGMSDGNGDSSSASEVGADGSPYDDDSGSQEEQSNSPTQEPSVSYEDDAEWTPFL